VDATLGTEETVPMLIFGTNLRKRALELNISNSEAARRCGLGERRYHSYVTGDREPDLATVVRIARALITTPNALLGVADELCVPASPGQVLRQRLRSAANALDEPTLELAVIQLEAVARRMPVPRVNGGLGEES
jgi:transcriptional regulator with XRE-family HTH domain